MSSPLLPDARLLAKGLAALRIFVGLIALLNGLAKLFGFRDIEIGIYKANLINLDETRQILTLEANKRRGTGTEVPGLKSLVNDVILAHYSVAEVLITAAEIGVGLALVLGIATRAGALVGLGQHVFLALLYNLEQPLAVRAAALVGAAPDPCVRGRSGESSRRAWGLTSRASLGPHASRPSLHPASDARRARRNADAAPASPLRQARRRLPAVRSDAAGTHPGTYRAADAQRAARGRRGLHRPGRPRAPAGARRRATVEASPLAEEAYVTSCRDTAKLGSVARGLR